MLTTLAYRATTVAMSLSVALAVLGAAPPQSPIAVQGAVDSELQPLLEALGHPEPRIINGFHFWEGSIQGRSVVLSRTEMGMVNAAVATTLLIREYQPSLIINQGTAGATDPALQVSDIVIGTASVPYAAVRTAPRGEGDGVNLEEWTPLPRPLRLGDEIASFTRFESDPELVAWARSTPYQAGKLIPGVVGSGDQWNREIDKLVWAHRNLGVDSEDMESAAVAQVALSFGVRFVPIRIISNSEYHSPEFRREVGATCAAFVVEMVKRLPE